MVPILMTKPYIEDLMQSLCLFSKKTAKDLFRDHNCMIICLMAGIQVVILSVDVPYVKGSTWMANPVGWLWAVITSQKTSDLKVHDQKTTDSITLSQEGQLLQYRLW